MNKGAIKRHIACNKESRVLVLSALYCYILSDFAISPNNNCGFKSK